MSSTVLTVSMDYNDPVKTTVTSNAADVDRILEQFVINSNKNYLIIGVGTELILTDNLQNRIALLELCDGKQCLIIQLLYIESLPRSLHNFLRLPTVTLAGIRLKKNMEMLEKEYGLQYTKAVDLESFCVTRDPRVCIPVIELQGNVSKRDLASVVCGDWGASNLTAAQIKCATMATYVAQRKGDNLYALSLNF